MGRNTISPEQDFSDWSSIRLERYRKDLSKTKRKRIGRDSRTCSKISKILDLRKKRYRELEALSKSWTESGKNINNMTEEEEVKLLDEATMANKNEIGLNYYEMINTELGKIALYGFSEFLLYKSVGKDTVEKEIKESVRVINLLLELLGEEDTKFIQFPDFWEEIKEKFSE